MVECVCVQDEMSRAELEAHVRMELNRKLADINTFLQQRSEQCDKLDVVSDNRHDEIRTQLRHAEQQLRVGCCRLHTGSQTARFHQSINRISWSATLS